MSTPNQPFHRVMAFMAALSAAMAKPWITQQLALAEVGPYVSRGKGQGKHSGKKPGNKSGRTYAANGKRECARRVRQMASGQLNFFNQQ